MPFSRLISACFLLAGFSPLSGFAEVVTRDSPNVSSPSVKKSAARAAKKTPVRAIASTKSSKPDSKKKPSLSSRRPVVRARTQKPTPVRAVIQARTQQTNIPVQKPAAPAPLYAGSPQASYTSSPGESGVSRVVTLKPLAPAVEKSETVRLDLVPKVEE